MKSAGPDAGGPMNVRLLAPLLLLVLVGGVAAGGDAARPNVVLILADDLGWGDVGFNGRREWATPNLDRLAAQGTRGSRFYSAGAVCAPSRAALLTGKYPIHCGVARNDEDLPTGQVTIAEALRGRGYATAIVGKWHHGRPARGRSEYVHPLDQGFDEFFGFTDATQAWEKFPEVLWDGRQRKTVEGYADDLFAGRAVDFLRRHKGGPFFLDLAFTNPHFNIDAPADEVARHAGRYREADPAKPVNATYAAMVTRLDRNVGRVLDELDALGLAGETLVLFTSDHGATFEAGNLGTSAFHDSNRPFRGQKRTIWEGGARVPFTARWPGRIPAGTEEARPAQMIDLFPTILAAAGGAPDPAWGVDGIDLLPAWTVKAAAPERTLFFEWRAEGGDQVAALRGDFKLVITRGGKPELYDVADDPAERRDVSARHPDLVRRLRAELKAWLATEVAAETQRIAP